MSIENKIRLNALNNDDLNLEEAISAYEKGMELKKICETRLKEAKLRIENIKDNKIETD